VREDRLTKVLEKAVEEIENCYGRETELSQNIRQILSSPSLAAEWWKGGE